MNRYQRAKSKGLCPQCETPHVDERFSLCPPCRKYQTDRRNAFRAANPGIYRTEEHRAYRNKLNAEIRQEAITAYGGVCVCCGEDYYPYLELDHTNGGGKKERQEIGAATTFYRYLKRNNWPTHMQVLCANCHRAKTSGRPCPPHV